MLKIIHILILKKKLIIKDAKFKVGDHLRILLKDTHQINLKKFL